MGRCEYVDGKRMNYKAEAQGVEAAVMTSLMLWWEVVNRDGKLVGWTTRQDACFQLVATDA